MARRWLLNDAGFIDPSHDAGSYVAARVGKPEGVPDHHYIDFTADVVLADCNRSIRWTFGANAHSLEKLRLAIGRLQRFERALIDAQRQYEALCVKAEARKKREEAKRSRKAKQAKPAAPSVRVVGPWPELPP